MKFGLAPPEDTQTVDELEAYLKEFEAHVRKLDTPILGGPRRHHYIPQFYLRRFANNGKRLIRMPLPAHPPPSRKPTNVEKLAVVKDFYTVLTEKGESAVIENLLGVWDSDASECLRKLTDKDAWPISANVKLRMSFWFGLLSVRSLHSRRTVEALADYLVEFTNATRKEGTAAMESKDIWGHQTDVINLMLSTACSLIEVLLTRRWQVMHLNSKEGLLLTDTCFSLVPGPSFRATGTGMANAAEILIPLDRHHLLCMHSFEGLDERLVELDPEASPYLARHYNNMLILSAYRDVFCHQSDYDHVLPLAERHVGGPLMGVHGSFIENLQVDGINTPPTRRSPRRYRDYGAPDKQAETPPPDKAS